MPILMADEDGTAIAVAGLWLDEPLREAIIEDRMP
jgi:hypothetical protein